MRAGIGGEGIEVPIEPPASSPALAAAREQRRIAAIEAAETAAAAARTQTPGRKQTRRSAGSKASTPLGTNDRPAPRPLASPATAPVVPAPRRDAPSQERTLDQLTTDLTTATTQIKTLRAQVSEQVNTLAGQATALSEARAQLVEAHAEVQASTARAETDAATIRQLRHELAMADFALTGIRQRVQTALSGDIATASLVNPDDAVEPEQDLAEPVMCEGGCGIPVDPAYVKRTQRRWHGGPCADLAAAAADRSPGRRAVA
jgi:hypothetical protein